MMEIIRDIEQGSEEWLEIRRGKVTASCFSKVLSKGQGKTRKAYMLELVAERVTGMATESFTNSAMEWGTATEPQARSMYEFISGNKVEECAFITLNDDVGVSPDGLIDDDGLLEIKCPKTTSQIERYLKGEFPKTYAAQVQGQLWVSERDWCDFVSFDPRIQGEASYFCVRVERDEKYIATLEKEILIFLGEMNMIIKKLKGDK